MTDELQLGFAALDRTASKNLALIERLVPLARELAEKAGPAGVTVADLRIFADQRGLLPESKGRALSFLGATMKQAGLIPTGQWRRSQLPKSHGNAQKVHIHPRWAA